MRLRDLHAGLADRLRDDPDDVEAITILADWLEEQEALPEAQWLQDNLHGLAPVLRRDRMVQAPALLAGLEPGWLVLRHGLIRGLLVPTGRERWADPTCRTLSVLPLAVGLRAAVLRDGPSARAWLPAIALHIPHLRSLHVPADVDPALLEGFRHLQALRVVGLPARWPAVAALPALKLLTVEVVGRSLSILDALEPVAVERLVLSANTWAATPATELVGFLDRVPVEGIESRGWDDATLAAALQAGGWEIEEEMDLGESVRWWVRNEAMAAETPEEER